MSGKRAIGLAYPKGTCRVVPFYFRGDDPYKEQEFLQAEYQHNLKLLHKKEIELEKTQQEYDKMQNEQQFCNNYASNIARNLGESSKITTEHVKLLEELADLQQQHVEIQEQINVLKYWTNPIEMDHLLKEEASLTPEIDQRSHFLEERNAEIDEMKRRIVDLSISEDYQLSVSSEVEARVAQQCRNRLKQSLNRLRNGLNGGKSKDNGVRTAMANEVTRSNASVIDLSGTKTDVRLELEEVLLKKKLAEMHRRASIKASVGIIEYLNEVLAMVGGEPVNMAEVRSKCDIDEIEQEEREMQARSADRSRVTTATSQKRQSSRISTPKVGKRRGLR